MKIIIGKEQATNIDGLQSAWQTLEKCQGIDSSLKKEIQDWIDDYSNTMIDTELLPDYELHMSQLESQKAKHIATLSQLVTKLNSVIQKVA